MKHIFRLIDELFVFIFSIGVIMGGQFITLLVTAASSIVTGIILYLIYPHIFPVLFPHAVEANIIPLFLPFKTCYLLMWLINILLYKTVVNNQKIVDKE